MKVKLMVYFENGNTDVVEKDRDDIRGFLLDINTIGYFYKGDWFPPHQITKVKEMEIEEDDTEYKLFNLLIVAAISQDEYSVGDIIDEYSVRGGHKAREHAYQIMKNGYRMADGDEIGYFPPNLVKVFFANPDGPMSRKYNGYDHDVVDVIDIEKPQTKRERVEAEIY